jgi:multiple sugar transport system permease protein
MMRGPRRRRGWRASEYRYGYLFAAPYLLAFALLELVPLAYGLYIAFHNETLIGGTQAGPFTFANFEQIFKDNTLPAQQFWQGIEHTAFFVLISVPFAWALSAILAYTLYHSFLRDLFRTVFFLPVVFSVSALGTLWLFLLATNGGLNTVLHVQIPWLTEQPFAWIALDSQKLWARVGFDTVIMYAGLTQVSAATFEAGLIDGAGYWKRFRYVALPQLRTISIIVIVLETIESFNLFAQPMIMTGGGPGSSTTTATMVIYNETFNGFDAGTGAAMGIVFGVILAAIAILQFRAARAKKSDVR